MAYKIPKLKNKITGIEVLKPNEKLIIQADNYTPQKELETLANLLSKLKNKKHTVLIISSDYKIFKIGSNTPIKIKRVD